MSSALRIAVHAACEFACAGGRRGKSTNDAGVRPTVHPRRQDVRLPRSALVIGTAAHLPCPFGVRLPHAVQSDRRPPWLIIAVIWTCVGALLVIQVHPQIKDRMDLHNYLWICAQQLARAVFWALLTPMVLRWRERWPLAGPKWWLGWPRHFAASLGLAALFWSLRFAAMRLVFSGPLDLEVAWRTFNFRNLLDLACYWSIIAVGWVISLNVRRQRAEVREAQLTTQLAAAELAALKQQLQPHFLFNCLNALSALMRDGENARAVDGLAKLSGLMRALMQNAGVQEVELSREIDYVQRYLDLEKLRFDEKLVIGFDIQGKALDALVPTLLLQPLVENAIKHGIARRRTPGRIRIDARVSNARLRLTVENDLADPATVRPPAEGQGLGLSTTRARLARVYGPDYALTADLHGPGPARIVIELPLRVSSVAPPRP